MVRVQKFAVKNINYPLLREELDASIVPAHGARISGYTNINQFLYTPFASTQVIATSSVGGVTTEETADPGQFDFRFENALTSPQNTALDAVLLAHDATGKSRSEINLDSDETAKTLFIQTFQNWDSLNNAQKSNRTKHLFRICARLLDRSVDL